MEKIYTKRSNDKKMFQGQTTTVISNLLYYADNIRSVSSI